MHELASGIPLGAVCTSYRTDDDARWVHAAEGEPPMSKESPILIEPGFVRKATHAQRKSNHSPPRSGTR